MEVQPAPPDLNRLRRRLVGAYLAGASLWILGSDLLLADATRSNMLAFPFSQSAKGLVFVLATGLLLNVVTARTFRRLHDAYAHRVRSERRMRALFDHAPHIILIADDEGRYVEANPAAESRLGYTREELLQRHIRDLAFDISPQQGEALKQTFMDQHVLSGEMRLKCKDGSVLETEYRAVAHVLPGLHLSFLQDITERNRYERELVAARNRAEEMSRLKTAFLANMSHEIRTPLTGIIGFADILAEEQADGPQEMAHLIRRAGERLLLTLNSVLDLAQLESGTLRLTPSAFDLVEETQALLPLFERQARERGLYLRLEHAQPQIPATADQGALSRILTNLISNALKYTEAGGVTVRLEKTRQEVVIEVADTGIGIGAAFLPHLFDAFTQESSGAARLYEGSGLGLKIVKELVDLMHGTVTAASEPGKGSAFTVRLPQPLTP